MVKIDFEYPTAYGVFRDALHLPENHDMTDAAINALKEQRRDNWVIMMHVSLSCPNLAFPKPLSVTFEKLRLLVN